MSAFEYLARFSFNKPCVTFNYGTDDQFADSIKDFYSDSLESLLKIDLHKDISVDMSKVSSYRRLIWRCTNHKTDHWAKVCEDTLINEDYKHRNCRV